MKYLDTVIEDVDRLKVARTNINKGIIIMFLSWIVFSVISFTLWLIRYYFSAIWIGTFAISFIVLIVGLIIKREIFSSMIYLKENVK